MMDLKNPMHLRGPYSFQGNKDSSMEGKASNPFRETYSDHPDPLCKLSLRETSDFVSSFPMPKTKTHSKGFADSPNHISICQRRPMETPSTPGRPICSLNSIGSPANFLRKSYPSKWDDAEKWLISTSCDESPGHIVKAEPQRIRRQHSQVHSKVEPFAEKLATLLRSRNEPSSSDQKSAFLDKYTDNVEPVGSNFRQCEPIKDGFLFRSSVWEKMKDAGTEVATEVQHREVGTETTPIGSSRNSRCQSPIKMPSPPRHNTPAERSGPLGGPLSSAIDISEIHDCDFVNLDLGNQFNSIAVGASNWSSREEEEEEISKSLRHYEASAGRKSIGDCKVSLWEDAEDKTKCCIRYQREEAKIQAWVNLQNAKAEAQSRKLEVKIQKLRSDHEQKLMRRMAAVHRKAEEWRAAAQLQHSQHMLKHTQKSQKINRQEEDSPCGCFH